MNQDFEVNEISTVRYSKWLGISFTVLGAIGTFLALWVMLLTKEFSVYIISNVIVLVLGILYLKNPYFTLEDNRLYLYNLLGGKIKQFSFMSLQELSIEDNKIYLKTPDNKRKLPITTWMTNKNDLDAVKSRIARQQQALSNK